MLSKFINKLTNSSIFFWERTSYKDVCSCISLSAFNEVCVRDIPYILIASCWFISFSSLLIYVGPCATDNPRRTATFLKDIVRDIAYILIVFNMHKISLQKYFQSTKHDINAIHLLFELIVLHILRRVLLNRLHLKRKEALYHHFQVVDQFLDIFLVPDVSSLHGFSIAIFRKVSSFLKLLNSFGFSLKSTDG